MISSRVRFRIPESCLAMGAGQRTVPPPDEGVADKTGNLFDTMTATVEIPVRRMVVEREL